MEKFKNFYEYYGRLSYLLQNESWSNAEAATSLLSLRDPHCGFNFLQILNPEMVYRDRRAMDWAFDDIIMLHLQTIYHFNKEDWQSAFNTQTNNLQLFNKEILQKEKDTNWFMPILYTMCSDLRLLASIADSKVSRVKQRNTEATSFSEEAASPIMESYRTCVAEGRLTPETSKKIGILNLTNQLFRIYFKINRLNLLKPLIRSIDNVSDMYERFSLLDRVTYNYFLGRKAMFDMDLVLSEKSLTFAFENCPSSSMRNKRFILMYLIPVKMFLGHMPRLELLSIYDLDQFSAVVISVKEGNLKQLNEALQQHQHFFIKCGIFLMLEKLKVITYRNLFKKVALILNTHLIKLEAFLVVLRYLESEMDADELACILANLIAQKLIGCASQTNGMGGLCSSCMHILLENESNVKIHVIEPTTVVMGEINTAVNPLSPPANGGSNGMLNRKNSLPGTLSYASRQSFTLAPIDQQRPNSAPRLFVPSKRHAHDSSPPFGTRY